MRKERLACRRANDIGKDWVLVTRRDICDVRTLAVHAKLHHCLVLHVLHALLADYAGAGPVVLSEPQAEPPQHGPSVG